MDMVQGLVGSAEAGKAGASTQAMRGESGRERAEAGRERVPLLRQPPHPDASKVLDVGGDARIHG
jgi:hypothetical protein